MKRFDAILRFIGDVCICLAIIGISANAALAAGTTANLSWTNPTQYVDNTALPASDIASVTITWAPASGQSGPSGTLTVASIAGVPPVASTVPVPCGNTTFTVAVTTSATAHYPNLTSTPSNAVPYATGVECGPKAATGLAVN